MRTSSLQRSKVTIADVARRAGVSPMTVSRVVNDPASVAEPRRLVQVARVRPQVRVLCQPPDAGFEVGVVDRVEPGQRHPQPHIRLGQASTVTIDAGANHQSAQGVVSWTSSQAEFTPTPIQTREERADLVYAVKIRVANENGALKIGMPADVMFAETQASK